MPKRKLRAWGIQALGALLLVGGVEVLFYFYGVAPGDGTATAYQLFLAILCYLDLPILACVAGYRKWVGALIGYGVTAALQASSLGIFTAPLYGIALRFSAWHTAVWVLLGIQILLTLGAAALGWFLRRRGLGMSFPGEH